MLSGMYVWLCSCVIRLRMKLVLGVNCLVCFVWLWCWLSRVYWFLGCWLVKLLLVLLYEF